MRRAILKFAAIAVVSAVVSACGGSDDPDRNLVQEAEAQKFTALLAAATKAGLADDLSDAAARLTVFAPTDAAFTTLATQLGFASAADMVTALDEATLARILGYHVLPTQQSAADLAAGAPVQDTIDVFEGAPATLALDTSSGLGITDAALAQAKVTKANVRATNGTIHAIDKVLVPPGLLNVVQMAQVNPGAFSSLVDAVVTADLAATLSGPGSFTVFAPTNTAFAAAPQGLSVPELSTVLTYHVLASQVLSSDLGPVFGTPVATVSGQSITINAGTPPTITDTTLSAAQITAVDVRASNGVIHVIDKVLIPNLGT